MLTPSLKQTITQLIETTLQKMSGVFLRVTTIKVYLKLLKLTGVDNRVKQLLGTLVKISELLYTFDSSRTPKSVLQLFLQCHLASS